MKAVVIDTKPGWFRVIVEHVMGDFHWRWELGPETPYWNDADVRARTFNGAVQDAISEVVDLYRPSLSMCENAYAGLTSPRRKHD